MAISVPTSATLLLGTAWTGTAPGKGNPTVSGTINSGSGTYLDATPWLTTANPDLTAAVQDGTTFADGGYEAVYAGLKAGMLNLTFINDFASAQLADKLNTIGLGGSVYFDLKPTSSARGTSNPSDVGQAIITSLPRFNASVGNLSVVSVSWKLNGTFATLTS